MRSWGFYFVAFGIGSFVLPMFGLQFSLLSLFGELLPFVGGALIVVGAIMLGVSFRKDGQTTQA